MCVIGKGQNPVRIVIDRELKISNDLSVYDASVKTIFITEKDSENSGNVFFELIDFSKPIAFQICDVLFKHQIQSLIVEGGTKTLETFIDENLWDEARVFKSEVNFIEGIKAPRFEVKSVSEVNSNGDILNIYSND